MQYLPLTELLAGVAEEAAELAQAALKLRRVLDGTNPTPKSRAEAMLDFEEEIADVQLYLDRIAYDRVQVANVKKIKAER
jgi:NTP pyrophosphatase (non-canonical NTP hydrolase)